MKQNKDKKPQTEIKGGGGGVGRGLNTAQAMDGIVIVAGALHFISSEVPAVRMKGLQDRFLTTH